MEATFELMGESMTVDEIVAQLNENDSNVRWFKVDDGTISWETIGPSVLSVQIVEACRDSGGPLKCRECKRPVSRDEQEIHFIEDGWCDCKECYEKATAELDDDDEDEPTEYRSCLRCRRRVEVHVEDSSTFQYCGYCLAFETMKARAEQAEAFIANLKATFEGVTDDHQDPDRLHTWEWLDENWKMV